MLPPFSAKNGVATAVLAQCSLLGDLQIAAQSRAAALASCVLGASARKRCSFAVSVSFSFAVQGIEAAKLLFHKQVVFT